MAQATRKELAGKLSELLEAKVSTDMLRRNESKWGIKSARKKTVGRAVSYDLDKAITKLKEYFELP